MPCFSSINYDACLPTRPAAGLLGKCIVLFCLTSVPGLKEPNDLIEVEDTGINVQVEPVLLPPL